MDFIDKAVDNFTVNIYSSRSGQRGGVSAMKHWLKEHMSEFYGPDRTRFDDVYYSIVFPTEKPPAMVGIDDRVLTFDGTWPSMRSLFEFKPWNKK
jgi:hypothetical protein